MGRCCCIMTCDDNKQKSESKFLLINRSNASIFPEDNRFVFILIIGALISGFSGYWYYVNAGRVVLAVFLWILTVLFLFFASWVSNNHSYLALKNMKFIICIYISVSDLQERGYWRRQNHKNRFSDQEKKRLYRGVKIKF